MLRGFLIEYPLAVSGMFVKPVIIFVEMYSLVLNLLLGTGQWNQLVDF